MVRNLQLTPTEMLVRKDAMEFLELQLQNNMADLLKQSDDKLKEESVTAEFRKVP